MKHKLDHHEIAHILSEIATLMELKGENPFKIRAYQNASRMLDGLTEDISDLIETDRLKELKGIGATLNDQIQELAKTGTLGFWRELRAEFPETLFDLLKVPNLGPKKVKILFEKLEIKSLGELEYACKENRLLKLKGFGEKTQQKILSGIEYAKRNMGSYLFADVVATAQALEKKVLNLKGVKRGTLAGSYRRRREIVRDLDLVCSSSHPEAVMKQFVKLDGVGSVIGQGDTKTSVVWKNGMQVDLRVVSDREYPYALHHFTGSKEHNTQLRTLAKTKGLKMNEYGLFRGEKLVPCKDETEIFKALGLHYIPPELREGMGEIEKAQKAPLPTLIRSEDIRGVFHVHSTYSDGKNSLGEMLTKASSLRLEYIGISDHSQSAFYAHGLKEADIDRQHKELDQLQKKFPKLRIFRGIESDILSDGGLDYPEKVLKKFDFVIGSVHSQFNMSEDQMTRRCMKAIENPRFTILGHPTGRLLLAREGFKIDLKTIIDHTAKHKKIVELNANPHRLDLDWRVLQYVKEKKVGVAINPDAHDINGLDDTEFGVNIARKGGLAPADVINTWPVSKMEKFLETKRSH